MGFYRVRHAVRAVVFVLALLLVPAAFASGVQESSSIQVPTIFMSHVQVVREHEDTVFTSEEMKAFMAAAIKADKISDPMERCLHSPDPPGSHWSRDGLLAYCRYDLQPSMDLAEFDRLIKSGHADELDRQFSSWESDAKGHPDVFYRFVLVRFGVFDPDRQSLIESWKQQSPHSAYAYALSGWNYMNAGWRARGGKFASDTPQSNFDAMDNVMDRARGDIEMSIRLNPRLSTPYAAMIDIGTATGDKNYAMDGAKRGLTATGDKFPIFMQLTKYTSSRWHGDAQSQQWLLAGVDRFASSEPLLHVVRAVVLSYAAGIDYDVPVNGQWSVYRQVLDDVATQGLLRLVGKAALDHDQYALAYVYLSEAERFDPSDQEVRDERMQAASKMASAQAQN